MALVIKRPLIRLMILTNSNHALKKNSNKLFAPLINIKVRIQILEGLVPRCHPRAVEPQDLK